MEKNVSFLMTKEEWSSFDKFLHFIACSNQEDKETMSTPLFNQFKFIGLDDFRRVKGITDENESVKGREMISVAMTNWQCRFIILMIGWTGETIEKIDNGELPEAIGFKFPKKIFDALEEVVEVHDHLFQSVEYFLSIPRPAMAVSVHIGTRRGTIFNQQLNNH